MNCPLPPTVFAGLDWGHTKHSLCVLDAQGAVVVHVEKEHTAQGVGELVALLKAHSPLAGVAVETNKSILVDALLAAALPVYPINPKVSKAWRDGWNAASPKSDPHDALVLADGLRHYHARLRPLVSDEPLTRELALLCADESRLIEERTALIHKLKAALREYYPAALQWFSDWTTPSSWDFVLAFPKPEALAKTSANKLRGFLKTHRIGLSDVWQQRIATRSQAADWTADPATIQAKAFLATALAKQLKTLQASLKEYRKRIENLFAQHPDSDIFSSLPGAGPKLAPRLLVKFGDQRLRFEDARALQQLSGAAPVTIKSGSCQNVRFRKACDKKFRITLHQFASKSIESCDWARAFYDQAIARGQSHNLALRNLANKWLKILYRMWMDHRPYDDGLYVAALVRKNSSVVHLMPALVSCE